MVKAKEILRAIVFLVPIIFLVTRCATKDKIEVDLLPAEYKSVVLLTNNGKSVVEGVTLLPVGSMDIAKAVHYKIYLPIDASYTLFTALPCGHYNLVIHLQSLPAQVYRNVNICKEEVYVLQKVERSNLLYRVPKTLGLYHLV